MALKRTNAAESSRHAQAYEQHRARLSVAISPAQLRESGRDLGHQLAAWRAAASLTQEELAARMGCSRSSIANIETGRQKALRRFWQQADRLLCAGGLLLDAFGQVEELMYAYTAQVAQAREPEHHGHEDGAAAGTTIGCGCARTVGRWGARETRALREALRMSVRAFAEHLGVTPATVGCWERTRSPKEPRLSTQEVLDQALKLAGADVRARFWNLLEHQ